MTDITGTWRRIETWLEANAPEVAAGLGPGATDAQIAAAERTLGVSFPDDVRASYRRHDGQEDDSFGGLLNTHEFLALERIVDEWQVWKDLLACGSLAEFRSEPQPGIRRDWWNAKWIPISHDGCGNHLCLDLDPALGGKMGQVIEFWHDDAGRSVVANGLGELLAGVADGFDSGTWVYRRDDGGVVRVKDVSG